MTLASYGPYATHDISRLNAVVSLVWMYYVFWETVR
jgi:hypothetical protein